MFLLIQNSEISINISLISEVDWTPDGDEATVSMVTGNEYTVEGADYHALRKALSL